VNSEERTELNDQVNEEAARWFVEFRSGEIDASGRRAFDAWVRASPEHLRAFIEIDALWRHSAAPDPQRRFSVEQLVASAREEAKVLRLDTKLNSGEALDPRQSGTPDGGAWVRRLAIAAVVLVAVGSWVIGSALLQRGATYGTEVGEQRSIRLNDGSTVTLNSLSRVRVEFDPATRNVELLEGQALFRVARNPSRPFIVHAGGTLVRAVGTEFDVNERKSGTVITVVEGRVAVLASAAQPEGRFTRREFPEPATRSRSSPVPSGSLEERGAADANESRRDGTVFVSAGEQIAVASGATHPPTRADVGSATAWTRGRVILQSATLEEVAELFNRYSARRLLTEDHGEVPFRLSGVFSTDPAFLLEYLRGRQDIRLLETATEVRIVHTDVR
jgi:transmembrane sensor